MSRIAPTLRAEDVPLHTHENASFVFVLSGSYLSTADGAPPVCAPSTVIFNPARTMHRDSFTLPIGRFLAVSISRQSLRMAAEGTSLPVAARAFSSGDSVATALRLARQCAVPGPDSSFVMEGLCWELISNVVGDTVWRQRKLPSWIGSARDLLHDRCAGHLQITEMAQQIGVHPVYFARAFRQAFRCTPGEYLMRCRLRKAMPLLRGAKVPLSDIALQAGFFDQSHFTRAFKQHFGRAPNTYRKRLHGDFQSAKFNTYKNERQDPRDAGPKRHSSL